VAADKARQCGEDRAHVQEVTVKVDELFTRAKDSLEATTIYAEPVKQDGTTVIPAARSAVATTPLRS
jgi:uncharacterized spore protein YtfJ